MPQFSVGDKACWACDQGNLVVRSPDKRVNRGCDLWALGCYPSYDYSDMNRLTNMIHSKADQVTCISTVNNGMYLVAIEHALWLGGRGHTRPAPNKGDQ